MTKYQDTRGVIWDSAQEALEDFVGDLPYLSDEDMELVFQFTLWNESPEFNLNAIQHGIDYGGYSGEFEHYPVPTPKEN